MKCIHAQVIHHILSSTSSANIKNEMRKKKGSLAYTLRIYIHTTTEESHFSLRICF